MSQGRLPVAAPAAKPSGAEAPRPASEGATNNPLPSPAATAKAEFLRRRQAWQHAGGSAPTDQADANLHLWLAIACAAGCADLPHGHPDRLDELEWFRADRIYPLGDNAPIPVYPHHIAPREQWQAELARARDTLLARAWHPDASDEQRTRAAAVAELARALNTPLHRTEERPSASSFERKAA